MQILVILIILLCFVLCTCLGLMQHLINLKEQQ